MHIYLVVRILHYLPLLGLYVEIGANSLLICWYEAQIRYYDWRIARLERYLRK